MIKNKIERSTITKSFVTVINDYKRLQIIYTLIIRNNPLTHS